MRAKATLSRRWLMFECSPWRYLSRGAPQAPYLKTENKKNVRSQLQSPWQREPKVGVELFTRDRPPQYDPDQWNRCNRAARLHCLGPESSRWDTRSLCCRLLPPQRHIKFFGHFIMERSQHTIIATCTVFGVERRSRWADRVGLDLYSILYLALCVCMCERE